MFYCFPSTTNAQNIDNKNTKRREVKIHLHAKYRNKEEFEIVARHRVTVHFRCDCRKLIQMVNTYMFV